VQLLAAFAPHRGQGVGQAVAPKTGEQTLEFLRTTVLPAFPRRNHVFGLGQPECTQEGTPLVGIETGTREVCLDTDQRT
jgi:hypothetical protein